MPVIIGRPINGISINGLEYVLDASGEPMVFANEEAAKKFLMEHNCPEDVFEDLIFEEVEGQNA